MVEKTMANKKNKSKDQETFNLSQSFTIIPHKNENVITIPLSYWSFLKSKLSHNSNGRHIWNKVGSIAFGTGLSSIVALMLGKYQNASEESWILAFSFIALGVALIALDQYKYDGKLENNCKQALDLILLLEQGFHIDNENTTMPEYSCAAEPLVQSGESHHSSPWEPLA